MISKTFPERFVLTTNGVKNIKDVYPGDKVYEWNTSNQLEISDIIMVPFHDMWELTYSDGRKNYIVDPEPIYLDQTVISPHSPFCKCLTTKDFPIKLCMIDFNKDRSKIDLQLIPDPYVAGALLIHGDLADPYVNCPLERTEFNNQFSHKYDVDYYDLIGDDKVYYKWKGDINDHRITWEEFFKYTDWNGDIPSEYIYTQPWNRVQFLRGAFDMGYYKDRSPHIVSMSNKELYKLKVVQMILSSIGISSYIYEEPEEKLNWCLSVDGFPESHPGFFYHYEYIIRMINKSYYRDYHNLTDEDCGTVTLVDIKALGCPNYLRNPIQMLKFDTPHKVYVSDSFLPQVSI